MAKPIGGGTNNRWHKSQKKFLYYDDIQAISDYKKLQKRMMLASGGIS